MDFRIQYRWKYAFLIAVLWRDLVKDKLPLSVKMLQMNVY